MGFFDSLFKAAEREATQKAAQIVSDKVKEGIGNIVGENKPTGVNATAPKPAAQSSAPASKYDTTPDLPRNFEDAAGWLCIKGATPEKVIEVFKFRNPQAANWESGMREVDANFMKKVFVSPMIDGYVLVIGFIPFGRTAGVSIEAASKSEYANLLAKTGGFEEMTCYATQSTVDLHVWAKYAYGPEGLYSRAYGWIGESGEVYINLGELTPEEISLGYTNLIQTPDCDWESVTIPDTSHVHAVAKAWSVAPDLSNVGQYTGVGYVCDLR